MVKKYLQFIKEADETEVNPTGEAQSVETDVSKSSKFEEIKDEVKGMVEKTIEKSGGEFDSFVKSFIKNPEDIKIEGFINDSDIYDFYLKWRNDIDELLNDLKFFNQTPTENNAFGLYEYIIKGTTKAFIEVSKMLK
jgi:hypothetical protein